jgi:hypothetical protein
VNRIDQETEKRRGLTRAVEPFKKKKKMWNWQRINTRAGFDHSAAREV